MRRIGYKDIVFFDDDVSNIKCCDQLNVTTCLVDRRTGLTWDAFRKGLEKHFNRSHAIQRQQTCFASWLQSSPQITESPECGGLLHNANSEDLHDVLDSGDADLVASSSLGKRIRSNSDGGNGTITVAEGR